MSKGITVPIFSPPAPNINSPSLAKTLNKVKPLFEGYKQQLDNLTSDIREVESFIRTSGIGEEFYTTVVYWSSHPDEYPNQIPLSHGAYRDNLSWEKHDESKSFRLMHRLFVEDDYQNLDLVTCKPLLESSVNTRKRVFPYLNKFLEQMSEAVSVKEAPKTFADLFPSKNQDIPF